MAWSDEGALLNRSTHLGKEIDGEARLSGEQDIEQSGNIAVFLNVMGVERESGGQGKEGLGLGEVFAQFVVYGGQNGGEKS